MFIPARLDVEELRVLENPLQLEAFLLLERVQFTGVIPVVEPDVLVTPGCFGVAVLEHPAAAFSLFSLHGDFR